MPTVTDLLQVATKRLYHGVTDTEMGNFLFCWGYSLCFILLLPLPISLSEKNLVGLLEQSHNPELRSTSKTGRFCLGAILGNLFVVPVLSTRRILSFVYLLVFFLIWILFL